MRYGAAAGRAGRRPVLVLCRAGLR